MPAPHAQAGRRHLGTTGSASVTIKGADFRAEAVTFENAFDEAAHPEFTGHQAVAVKTAADRVVFDNVRFLGNQDTLYLDSPSATVPARVYVHDSYVEGDVDFIFGRATAVLDDTTINALPRASDPSGYVYDNRGPGAVVNEHRPQLSDAEAADHEIDDYLAGDDGWAPHARR